VIHIIYNNIIGNKYQSKNYGEFEVINRVGSNNRKESIMRIRFTKTGYEYNVPLQRVLNCSVKDPYNPVVFGVGYIGNSIPKDNKKEYSLWTDMLRRCYDEGCGNYKNYGALGVSVESKWHSFETFLSDIVTLNGYNKEKLHNGTICLDKDKMSNGVKVYGKDKCCFLSRIDNQQYTSAIRSIECTSPTGESTIIQGTRKFAREHGLDAACIQGCIIGKRKTHKGWQFRAVV
jgi:hypothetical protein